MLFVFGTQAAIIRTTAFGLGAVNARHSRRLAVFVAIVISDIGANEIFDEAVFGAAFAEINAAIPDYDFGIDQAATTRTQAARGAEICVIAELHNPITFQPSSCPTVKQVGAGEIEKNTDGYDCAKQEKRDAEIPSGRRISDSGEAPADQPIHDCYADKHIKHDE